MSSPDQHVFDDQYLVRYLLGALPPEETERLDELSIADDDFAWRLRGVENDLVDAYVRSELEGETLNSFRSFYLSSARRRHKVEFAAGLRQFQNSAAAASHQAAEPTSGKAPFPWRIFVAPRPALQFGLAATAFVMFLVAGYLLFDNARLHREMNDARAQHGSIDVRTRQLEKELSEQRAVNAETQKKLDLASRAAPDLEQIKTVSLVLPPPTRGLSSIQSLTVRRGTDLVVLLLTLESAEFPRYLVMLRDPVANRVLWRSPELEPVSIGGKSTVSVSFRADLLKQQNYIAEVVGLPQGSVAWIVGDYPFHVVLR